MLNNAGRHVIRVKRKLDSTDVVDALTDLFIPRGPPEFARSDNGPEFIAEKVRNWIGALGAKTVFIEPGSPWENGYCESFNSRFRDGLLIGGIFFSLREARILIEQWRRNYNTVRPHSSLGYQPPALESSIPMDQTPTMHQHFNRTTRWGQSTCPASSTARRFHTVWIQSIHEVCGRRDDGVAPLPLIALSVWLSQSRREGGLGFPPRAGAPPPIGHGQAWGAGAGLGAPRRIYG